jgi:hypothetical protein
MPSPPYNAFRQVNDQDAALIAIGSVLKVILERYPVDKERVDTLLNSAVADDVEMTARAQCFAAGCLTKRSSERHSDRGAERSDAA